MAITAVAPAKKRAESVIARCRAVVQGEQAMHAARTDYLPKLDGMTDDQYNAYLKRTMFFNAAARTVDGLVGSVFRKDVSADFDEKFEQFAEDVTGNDLSLDRYAMDVLTEMLSVGLCGTLLDYSDVPAGISVAEAEKLGYGANWTLYTAENIRNWKTRKIHGKTRLTLVVLDESYVDESTSDEFEDEVLDAIRVLRLDDTGLYTMSLYVKIGEQWIIQSYAEPKINGKRMEFIPFIIHTVSSRSDEIDPPLLDIVNVNVKHYQLKADHAHALHFVALPTPYITGADPEDENTPSSIGPTKLWIIPNDSAKVGMLEFTGAGIEAIEKELNRMEHQMAALGARMLAPAKDFAETATAEQIKSIGEHSMLYKVVTAMEGQFHILCEWTAMWIGSTRFEMKLNRDFVSSRMSAQDILAMVSSWQKGAISKEQMFENFKKGEVISEDANFEDEEAKINMELGDVTGDDDAE